MAVRSVDVLVSVLVDVNVAVIVVVAVIGLVRHGRTGQLPRPVGEDHVHLGRLDASSIHPSDLYPDIWKAQSGGEAAQPLGIGPGSDQRAQHHVSADPRGRVQDGEPTFQHRLKISPGSRPEGKPRLRSPSSLPGYSR